ncbi:cuscuta receptor 1-like [Vicia villosa]|uniref:cuscuta receptor 1-like n=1 Tax=Vicia villosa TaxID=3911 RepID=UPI00273B0200|nr:cuscuta receptor 1-like [Vicia villosa]
MKMKMKRLLVCVFVLVEVLMCCEGCWKQERDALITLKSHFENATYPWERISTNCCKWDGVECNTITGRVTKLNLQNWGDTRQVNYSDFIIFNDLNTLDLSSNSISSCSRTRQGLKSLEVLNLGVGVFDNAMSLLSCLDGLSSLRSLSFSGDPYYKSSLHIFQPVLETISSKMRHLEVLDLSFNNLTNEILPSLRGFTSLKELNLRNIGLDSDLHMQGLCIVLKNLEILDISDNNFSDSDIGFALSGLSSLKNLNLGESQIIPKTIHNISKLRNLEILDLSGNNFTDIDIGSALSGSSLKSLRIGFSEITPKEIHNISELRSLEIIDLSSNNLEGTLDISGLLTLPRLRSLDLGDNRLVNFIFHKGSKTLSKLDILTLDSNMINGSNLQESLWVFPSVRKLSLSRNQFTETILAGGLRSLSNLEYLALDGSSNLSNDFFKRIGDLPSLKVLSARQCGLNGTLPNGDWFELKMLEELYLSENEIVGKLPTSFVNMTSLRTLMLYNNHFIGNFGPNLASLASLEYLNFEGNQFEFPISFKLFSNHSNLKFIYGNGNKVISDSDSSLKTLVPKFQLQVLQLSSVTQAKSIPLPKFLLYQYNLTYVDFTSCKLRGEFPNWLLENNTKMEDLILMNSSFIGHFQLPTRPCLNMVTIDVSNNAISGQMLSNNISSIFPNLNYLNLSGNAIHGPIPYEISHLSSLSKLDLSDNQLSGQIPHNLSADGGELTFLRFSNNNLHGSIPLMLSMSNSLLYLLLDGNGLSGKIPSNFFNSSKIEHLDLSNNNFIGKIPSQVKNSTNLIELSMSNNYFEGSIPSDLAKLEGISYLDLSQNNLSGCVPSFVNSSATFIHLSDNHLSCLSKNMFGERSSSSSCLPSWGVKCTIVTLDLSNNEITNGIHDLIHDLRNTGLNILLLKGNRFKGNIPKQLCHLSNLSILDLSFNNFVGEIPSCLGNIPFENKDPEALRDQINGVIHIRADEFIRFGKDKEKFTSKKRIETYTTNVLIYMSGIDLSHNQLNGSIPSELGNLTRILALNLSNNYFSGKIPTTFSNLVQVESLDLSFNMLSGQIPPQLSGLTSLEVFSVAHNNLSGTTPERKGQFITFDESSYEGNQFLCGFPLPKSCNSSGEAPNPLPNDVNMDGDNDSWIDMYVFRVSFVVAYTSMLLVIAIVLFINPYWRKSWFYHIGLVGMNCYYFLKDNLC